MTTDTVVFFVIFFAICIGGLVYTFVKAYRDDQPRRDAKEAAKAKAAADVVAAEEGRVRYAEAERKYYREHAEIRAEIRSFFASDDVDLGDPVSYEEHLEEEAKKAERESLRSHYVPPWTPSSAVDRAYRWS